MTEVVKPGMMNYRRHVLVCVGSKCTENGAGLALYEELKSKLEAADLQRGELRVIRSKVYCLGTCMSGPLLCVQPEGVWYYAVDSEKLDKIIDQHLRGGVPVQEYIYHQGPQADGPENGHR